MRSRQPGETTSTQCVAVANDIGTVTLQGDLLIMKFDVADGYTCGIRERSAGVTVRYRIDWVDAPYSDLPELQLVLRDIDCTSDEMYRNDRLRRR